MIDTITTSANLFNARLDNAIIVKDRSLLLGKTMSKEQMYETWQHLWSMKDEVFADDSAPETLKAALMMREISIKKAIDKLDEQQHAQQRSIIDADKHQYITSQLTT
jgi:hypothetical protein